MRYRAMDENYDWTFGQARPFLTDSPEAVAQAVLTRLRLIKGEFFLDTDEGTDYMGGVMGTGTYSTRDHVIRERILGTPGVLELLEYSSDVTGRSFSVSATLSTQYGSITISSAI